MTTTIIIQSQDGDNMIETVIDYTQHIMSCLREQEIDRIAMDHSLSLKQARAEGGADE